MHAVTLHNLSNLHMNSMLFSFPSEIGNGQGSLAYEARPTGILGSHYLQNDLFGI